MVRSVDGYRSPDGQVELDALAELAPDAARPGSNHWVVSIKWRSKRTGRKELEQLAGQAANLNAQGWMITRAGCTPEALAYARQVGIFTSTAEDLARLAKLLR